MGAAFGAVASIAAFLKWVWPIVRQGYRNIMGHAALDDKLTQIGEQLTFVVKEMRVNGGTTVKDALNRIEKNLELTNERLRAGLRDSDEMCFEADEKGRVIWANRTVMRTLGRSPEQIMGQGWVNIIAPSVRDRVVKKWQESIDQHREFEMEVIWQRADGTEFPVFVHSYRMADANNNTLGYFGTVKLL